MDYRVYLYVIFTFLCIYTFSAIDFSEFLRADKNIEARIIVFILSFAFSYLLTNFVYDFLNCCKFI